jgi:hypothetical protein
VEARLPTPVWSCFLVALARVRDLLLSAKHLFVAARTVWDAFKLGSHYSLTCCESANSVVDRRESAEVSSLIRACTDKRGLWAECPLSGRTRHAAMAGMTCNRYQRYTYSG